MAQSCSDFERGAWRALRSADASVESMTTDWERWRDESPQRFTNTELERLRVSLHAANEAVAAGEGAFSSYWETKKLRLQNLASEEQMAAARANLSAAVDAAKRAVASAREFWSLLQAKPAPAPAAPLQAGFDYGLLLILLGEFAGAALGGKKGAISQAAANLIAAVLEANEQAGGEDIELELPSLRARIAARRARLSQPVTPATES